MPAATSTLAGQTSSRSRTSSLGYEIKSDFDSRVRLQRQVRAYGALCDFCTVVVGPRHLAHVRAALPTTWGILVAEPAASGVLLRCDRQATRNLDVEPAAIARQFWKTEVIALLKEHGAHLDRRAYVHVLWPLVEALPIDVLRARLRVALVAHEEALKDVRVERREEQRGRRAREKTQREARARLIAEWAAHAGEET